MTTIWTSRDALAGLRSGLVPQPIPSQGWWNCTSKCCRRGSIQHIRLAPTHLTTNSMGGIDNLIIDKTTQEEAKDRKKIIFHFFSRGLTWKKAFDSINRKWVALTLLMHNISAETWPWDNNYYQQRHMSNAKHRWPSQTPVVECATLIQNQQHMCLVPAQGSPRHSTQPHTTGC